MFPGHNLTLVISAAMLPMKSAWDNGLGMMSNQKNAANAEIDVI